MKFNLEEYNFGSKKIKGARSLKEGILIAIGFAFLISAIIFTN